MMITTCLILWMPDSAVWLEGAGAGADEVQDATSKAAVAMLALQAARRIPRMARQWSARLTGGKELPGRTREFG